MRGYHDMGGLPAGPVERKEHDHAPWEKRVDALMQLMRVKGLVKVDELRRAIESLGADVYERLNYYERWIGAMTNILVEKGVITVDELGRRMEEVRARHEAER